MKLLFDIDVVLDLLLDRKPHAQNSAHLLSSVETGEVSGCISATAVTTIFYLVSRSLGARKARQHVRGLLSILDVAPVARAVLAGALEIDFSNYEDAVTHEAARGADVDAIVTRNTRDFRKATIPVYSPSDMLSLILARRTEKER